MPSHADIKAALLRSSSLIAAAGALGISVSELARELADPVLKKDLDEETRAIYNESLRRLQRSVDSAVDTLNRAKDRSIAPGDRPDKNEIEAAKAILTHAGKAGERFNLEDQLNEWEARIAAEDA